MSDLMKRMKKASVIENAAQLSKSELFNLNNLIPLPVPMMNVAFSGKLDGGFNAGLHQIAGASGSFKTNLCLVLLKAYQDKYQDGIILFYDSEFGASNYFKSFGIDEDRVLHIPIMNLEEFTFDVMKKLEDVQMGDNLMIFVDSIGSLASKKEVEDALKESSAADMTRAKKSKGLTRMITPYLTKFNIPMLCINHIYSEIGLYPKDIVSGGTGWKYSSHSVFIMGKRQIKDGTDLQGFEFIMKADKSRYIKEKTAIPITVTFEGGISKWSGLMDVALATGHVTKPKNGWYTRPKYDVDKNWRMAATNSEEFWQPLLDDDGFKKSVESMFSLTAKKSLVVDSEGNLLVSDIPEFDPETGEVLE